MYAHFIEENLEVTHNKKDSEEISLIYSCFKEWFADSYSDKTPNKQYMLEYFEKGDYTIKNGKIYGVRLANKISMAVELD